MFQETKSTAASRFAHTPELLLCLADVTPNNKNFLFNLCLVSRTTYNIFKPLLWRDMCQGDFYAKQESLDSCTDSENLVHMRTYDDNMAGIRTTREFNHYNVFSHVPNLELAAFEPAYEELLEMIQGGCPKIRGLHLEMCEYRPEINPSVFSAFSNLTHLVLDSMTIENDGWTWHEQAESLTNLLIHSPQMRKFGLRAIGLDERVHYFFVLVSETFAKNNSSGNAKLRLNTLLLDSYQYPPPSRREDDPSRYISQLTDVRYLEHLHIEGAGHRRPTYDVTCFSGTFGVNPVNQNNAVRKVQLPSFISPETTPNLRLLSFDSILCWNWLRMMNFSQSEFANQLSVHFHPTKDNMGRGKTLGNLLGPFYDWAENPLQNDHNDLGPSLNQTTTTTTTTTWPQAERKWNFRSTILELEWSHRRDRNEGQIKAATVLRGCLAEMKRTGQDTLKDLTIYLKNCDRHELPETKTKDPPTYFDSFSAPIAGDIRLCQTEVPWIEMSTGGSLPDEYWRGGAGCLASRSALEMVEPVIMSYFGGLGAGFLKRLYVPMYIRTEAAGNLSEEEADEWTRRLIQKLAAEDCLPGLRYVKLHGPAYEINRRPGGEIRLLKLSWAEEREIELFRPDVWAPWWS